MPYPPQKKLRGVGYGGSQSSDANTLNEAARVSEGRQAEEDGESTLFLVTMKSTISLKKERARWIRLFLAGPNSLRLAKVLGNIFCNQVPTDWEHRADLYQASLDVCRALCTKDVLVGSIFGHDKVSLQGLIDFGTQAKEVAQNVQSSKRDKKFANQVLEVAELVENAAKHAIASGFKIPLGTCQEDANDQNENCCQEKKYKTIMGPLRFSFVDSLQGHSFAGLTSQSSSTKTTRKLFKELTSFSTALPVEFGSSVFVRSLQSRINLLRVLITGPDETPYANGCWVFDVYLPPNYPQAPPKVKFLTTGQGQVRFNPNLYQDGKVCLSLLGTWSGPGWVPNRSTLLQVLVSIQSLIFVKEPYFNEPGYERMLGTTRGAQQSQSYNINIQKNALKWAFEVNGTAYPEFQQVVLKHFAMKRLVIDGQLDEWKGRDTSLARGIQKLKRTLVSLEEPEVEMAAKPAARRRTAPETVDLTEDIRARSAASTTGAALDLTESPQENIVDLT